MNETFDLEGWLTGESTPAAVYLPDSDCVEYVAEDTVCIHRRIDEMLSLVFDETGFQLVGFKLKGFRNLFERAKAELCLDERHFVALCRVLEKVCMEMGEREIGDERRRNAYRAAEKLAARDGVLLDYRIAA